MVKYIRFQFLLSVVLLISTFSFAQQSRIVTSFNDSWLFKKVVNSSNDFNVFLKDTLGWENVSLPHTWNNKDMQSGPDYWQGIAYYKKQLNISNNLEKKRVFIRFKGIGNIADIYVNGNRLGQHRGAYSAFTFEITKELRADTINTIVVKVDSRPDVAIIPINNKLFGIFGGIYRPVEIITTNNINFSTLDYSSNGIYIRQLTDSSNAKIFFTAKLENKNTVNVNVILRTIVKDAANKVVKVSQKLLEALPQGMNVIKDSLVITQPHLWNGRQDPYLYTIENILVKDDQVLDSIHQLFGFRNVVINKGKIYLNGKRIHLHGVSRHQEWQDYGSALSDSQHRADIQMIYEMGANSIRFAHYQQSETMYRLCDSLGILAWAEIPFVNAVSTKEGDNCVQQMNELILQNFNHPSIFIWGLHNEVYSKTTDGFVPTLTRQLNNLAKTLDEDRYTVSVSGYGEMNRPSNLMGDVQGFNRYYGWYEGKIPDLEEWTTNMNKDYPNYNYLISEYGTEANVYQQKENISENVGDPSGKFWPEGFQTRFHEIQWGIIENHPELLGSYVWNMFDFSVPIAKSAGIKARNMKGLVTYDRKIKKDAFYWYKANWNSEPMIYIADRRDSIRKEAATQIEIFTNIGNVQLQLNGKKISNRQFGTTEKALVFPSIQLKKGKNVLVATGRVNGKLYSDKVIWYLN